MGESFSLYESCTLCPRACGAKRTNGERGYCRSDAHARVAHSMLHHWEEPCLSGRNGSGTVFFSGCSLKCVYCQNYDIAVNGDGGKVSKDELGEIFLNLQKKGAHNINLVTPTHYVLQIAEVLKKVKPLLNIPVVYNTSGYELSESIKLLDGLVDIYLTDFKYFFPETAKKYSNAENYPEFAKSALEEMVRQKPKFSFDENKIRSVLPMIVVVKIIFRSTTTKKVMLY